MNLTTTAPAAPSSTNQLSTYRLILAETGRTLRLGFSAAQPSLAVEPQDAAEFSCLETAHRVAKRIHERMSERTKAMGLPTPPVMFAQEVQWPHSTPMEARDRWNALQRMDATSVEVGRFEAVIIPAFMRQP